MIGEPRLVVPDEPLEADRLAILTPLIAFNDAHTLRGSVGPLAVLIKDHSSTTIGGLWGFTSFDWLQIELLFVPEARRGASIGTRIVQMAETLAAERGCIGASLDTYSFQARGFYEKLGYTLMGTIPDCPPGGARHFLQKRFETSSEIIV